MSIRVLPWPEGKRSPVTIRDDDISFFTSSKMLSTIYEHAWKRGYTVDFGVVPRLSSATIARQCMRRNPKLSHLKFEPCIPQSVRGVDCENYVGNNEELVAFLQGRLKAKKCRLLLHGYTHGRGIFLSKNTQEIRRVVHASLGSFGEAFGFAPDMFVFPYNECSQEAVKVVSSIGVSFVFDRPRSLLERGLSRLGLNRLYVKNSKSSISLFSGNRAPVCAPIYTRFPAHEAFEKSKEDFRRRYAQGKVLWLVNHFWEFYFDWESHITSPDFLSGFNDLLDYVARLNVWRCSVSDLAEWLLFFEKLHIRRRSKSEILLEGEAAIDGLAFEVMGRLSGNELTRDYMTQLDDNKWVVNRLPPNKKMRIKCI